MSKIDSAKTEKTCETCKYCSEREGGTGFLWYYCTLCPGLAVGAHFYLGEKYFVKACEKYEERAPARRG